MSYHPCPKCGQIQGSLQCTCRVHVQLSEDTVFCGSGDDEPAVIMKAWRSAPETIQRATCEQCLLRIFMLGDSATIALARMGRRVAVCNAPEEIEPS